MTDIFGDMFRKPALDCLRAELIAVASNCAPEFGDPEEAVEWAAGVIRYANECHEEWIAESDRKAEEKKAFEKSVKEEGKEGEK